MRLGLSFDLSRLILIIVMGGLMHGRHLIDVGQIEILLITSLNGGFVGAFKHGFTQTILCGPEVYRCVIICTFELWLIPGSFPFW